MSRPKPTVVLENINRKTYKSEQVLEADAIWAVFYKDKPFNLKSSNTGSLQSAIKERDLRSNLSSGISNF